MSPSPSDRPAFLKSSLHECGFLLSLTVTAIISAALSGAMSIALPALQRDLRYTDSQLSWVQSSYSLVTGSFLLLSGSLADILGRKRLLLSGSLWLSLWLLISGFASGWLIICRALQGLGAAMMLPASIGILGASYTTGRRRNVAFAIYGAGAPVGFSFGLVFGGVCAQFLSWRWIMWIFSILTACLAVLIYFSLPADIENTELSLRNLDWTGVSIVTTGLILLIFSLTSAPNATHGWKTPYIIAIFIISIILLTSFFIIERKVNNPLLPPEIWQYQYFIPIALVMFFFWGAFNTQSYFATLIFQEIDHSSPLLTTAKFLPMAIAGTLVNVLVAFIVGRMRGSVLLGTAGLSFTAAMLLFSEAPTGLTYWAMKFPSLCLVVLGADIAFNVANLFFQSSVKAHEKSLAGGILSTVTNVGSAFGIALSSSISGAVAMNHGQEASFRAGLRTAAGLAALGLLLVVVFVRVHIVGVKKQKVEHVEVEVTTKA